MLLKLSLCIIERSITDVLNQLHKSNDSSWHKIICSWDICPKYRKDFMMIISAILLENTTCHTLNVFHYYGEIRFSFFFWAQRYLSVWMQMRWILIKFCSSFCEACCLIYIGFLDLYTFSDIVFVPSESFWDYFCNDMFLTLLSHWGFSQKLHWN